MKVLRNARHRAARAAKYSIYVYRPLYQSDGSSLTRSERYWEDPHKEKGDEGDENEPESFFKSVSLKIVFLNIASGTTDPVCTAFPLLSLFVQHFAHDNNPAEC